MSDEHSWRLIEDGAGDAAYNMLCDEAVFKGVAKELVPPTLRLYEWERPSVTIGRFQSVERTVRTENCGRLGVPIVRRITGGRGILHGHDLTVSASGFVAAGMNVASVYEWLAQGFVAAFGLLEIAAEMGTCSMKRPLETQGDCFACVSQADVVSATSGLKLLGAALHLRQSAFLMQASIPLFLPDGAVSSADVFTGQGSQTDAALRGISMAQMRGAVRQGFADALNFRFDFSPEIDSLCAL